MRKVLIVDDVELNRTILKASLEKIYDIIEAVNGEDALDKISRHHHELSAVLLDIHMPVMDGYEALSHIRQNENYSQLPIIVVTGTEDAGARVKALSLGADDFISKPYNMEIVMHCLHNNIRLCENATALNTLRFDKLTGIYNREYFFERADEMIQNSTPDSYIIACFDIDNFKLINDQYGTAEGDRILRYIGRELQATFDKVDGICGRISGDNFVSLFPNTASAVSYVTEGHVSRYLPKDIPANLFVSVGRCVVSDTSIPASALYDRAAIAKRSVKGRYDRHIAYFDDSMLDKLVKGQEIIRDMDRAIKNHEFEVWFQPQYNHATKALIGAEALVRWRHPVRGLIPPGDFIGVFERNGFIYNLDKYVWEETCKYLRKWIVEERDPLPVSINISRYDIFREDLLEVLTGLLMKYDLPVRLLRLEITESAFSKSVEQITSVIRELIDFGFTVEIDDFGSGYSSLNTLKDVPAQILKLDMRFLEDTAHSSKRSGNILESIVRMAKWLGMSVIAEGVETQEQADFLESVGCVYIQGYFYARPMCSNAYESLAESASKSNTESAIETVGAMSTDMFWDPKSIDTLIFSSYVGGACVLEFSGDRCEIVRVNKRYIEVIRSNQTTAGVLSCDPLETLSPEDKERFLKAVRESAKTGNELKIEFWKNFVRDTPVHSEYIRCNGKVIAQTQNRIIVYMLVENITAQKKAEASEKQVAAQLEDILAKVNGGISAAVFNTDGTFRLIFANDRYYNIFGYTREQYKREVASIESLLSPDDVVHTKWVVKNLVKDHIPQTIEYCLKKRDGSVIYVRCSYSISRVANVEEDVVLSVLTDITEIKNANTHALETAMQLQAIMSNISGGVSAATLNGKKMNYIFANEQYYKIFGYTKEQFESELANGILDIIVDDDLNDVLAEAEKSLRTGLPICIEYRVRKRDGYIIYVRRNSSVCHLEGVNDPVHISVTVDITDHREAQNQLQYLNEAAHEVLAQPDTEVGITGMLHSLLDFFDGNRVYVFEFDYENKTTSNTYEVCKPNVTKEIGNLQNVPFDVISFWLHAFDNSDFIAISDVDSLPQGRPEKELLQAQGITSVIAVPLRRDGVTIGFIGVDDTRQNHNKVEHLYALGDYMSVLLTRRDYEAKLTHSNAAMKQMMQDMPGGFAQMIITDKGTVPIYLNDEFCRLCGLTLEEAYEMYSTDAYVGVHEDDIENTAAAIQEAVNNRSTVSLRIRFAHKNGGYVPMQVFYRVTSDNDGNLYLNGYYSDATVQIEQEKQRAELLDNLPEGAALYEYDGKSLVVLHLNQSYWNLVGRSPDKNTRTAFLRFVHKDDIAIAMQEINAAITQNHNFNAIIRVLHGNGEYVPFRIFANIVQQPNGKYLLYATYTPISEDAPQYSETLPVLLSAIMMSSNDLTFVKGRDYRYICASNAFARMCGQKSAADIIGKTDYDIFDKEKADKYRADDERLFINGGSMIDKMEIIPSQDGTTHYSTTSKFLLHDADGAVIGLYGVGRDVTMTRDAFDKLKLITESIPGGIASLEMCDGKLRLLYCNEGFYQFSGYNREEYLELTQSDPTTLILEEDLPSIRATLDKLVDIPSEMGICTFRCRTKDDSYCWFSIHATVSEVSENRIVFNVVQYDITEQKKKEQLLIDAYAQLELLNDNLPGGLATYTCTISDEFVSVELTYFNDGYCELFGQTREEYAQICAISPFSHLCENDVELLVSQLNSFVRNETMVDAVFHIKVGNASKWITYKAAAVGREGNKLIVNVLVLDISAQYSAIEQLKISEEENRLAVRHSKNTICRFDVASRTMTMPKESALLHKIPECIEDVPYGQIRNGMLAPDSENTYIAFFESIIRGIAEGEAVYQFMTSDGWRWKEAHYSTVFDRAGAPVFAVISFFDVTDRIEKEAIVRKWKQSLSDKDSDTYSLYRCNLSRDSSFDTHDGALLQFDFGGYEQDFNLRAKKYAQQCIHEDDRERYLVTVNSDALLASYYRGKRRERIDYREYQDNGRVRWLSLTIELVEYPNSTDIAAYLLYEDIDKSKLAELETKQRAESDPLTGVMNRSTFIEKMELMMEEREEGYIYALFMLDLDGFKQVNDNFGHSVGDATLIEVGQKLKNSVRNTDLVCRLGGDEFMVCLCGVPNRTIIVQKAKQICAILKKSFSLEVQLSVSMGIAVSPNDGDSFDDLYHKADLALYHVKETGKDRFAFYTDEMGYEGPRPEAVLEATSSGRTALGTPKRRMLIVDDDKIERSILINLFKDDFIIDTADDGSAALIRLRRYGSAISVVLLDLMMPHVDGFSVLEKMRQSPETQAIPIIVVSCLDERETSLRAIKSGASDYITKPVDVDLLRLRVDSAISKSENERLRAENRYLAIQNDEVERYRTILGNDGTVFAEYCLSDGSFTYDKSISLHIAGTFDSRTLWDIFSEDNVAQQSEIDELKQLVFNVFAETTETSESTIMTLRTPSDVTRTFRVKIIKRMDEGALGNKAVLCFTELPL